MAKIHCVVGGQFGSEAKGAVAAFLSTQVSPTDAVVGVRVGGPNAGHTIYGNCPPACTEHVQIAEKDGIHPWRLRQVPVLAVSRKTAVLYIAPGSEIDIKVLLDEVASLDEAGYNVSKRIVVDRNATVITEKHKQTESKFGMTGRIGSTAKGIGAARADRIMRTAGTVWMWTYDGSEEVDLSLTHIPRAWVKDVPAALAVVSKSSGASIIIEGTQGYGLGLHTEYYPYTTSGDCRNIDMLAQCGLVPWATNSEVHTWVVVRPYPIRVAGNSGPLSDETTWAELGLPEEQTTVTRKVRRVGMWDAQLVNDAIEANGGVGPNLHLVLSMLDHLLPDVFSMNDMRLVSDDLRMRAQSVVGELESTLAKNARVELVGTGPQSMLWYSTEAIKAIRRDPFIEVRKMLHNFAAQVGIAPGTVLTAEHLQPSDDELTNWWLTTAQNEVAPMVAKAQEYGGRGAAIDLIEIGRDLARMTDPEHFESYSDAHFTEIGIYFYLRGKFGRWQAAMLEGHKVSDDTLHDIGVYVRMAQRTRAVGGWPYGPEKESE